MFLAKSNGETLREHVEKCLQVFQSLYEKYPDLLTEAEWDLLRQAVIAHDLGKINPLFQKLMKEGSLSEKEWNQWMPHGQLSPAMIKKDARTDKIEQIILVCAIYYHHDREKTDPDIMRSYILDVLKPEWEQVEHTCPFLTNRKVRPSYYSNQVQKLDELKDDEILRYILIKGCLNRIDYCASAGRLEIEASSFINGKDVAQCTENFMEKQGYARREMQTYLTQHEGENLIVTASTGSGKTEGALLWMKDSKGFYTLPLKVSINSIWRRIHENMGYKPAVLLHSDAKGFYLTQASDQDKYETARLFAAPLTITTIDQLFQFVYKVNGAEAAASALATARLVIDEIQMYEPELPDSDLQLYRNPNGGSNYHVDANCSGVKSQYLPLTGDFTYGDLEKDEFKKLTPCSSCGAPVRPETLYERYVFEANQIGAEVTDEVKAKFGIE